MERESVLVLVGGASGSGKTTLVKNLLKIYDGINYRRNQGFFDIAEQKGIPKNEAYNQVSSHEVNLFLIQKCVEHKIVFSDVHYAVQMLRDKKHGIGMSSEISKEKYKSTISDDIIDIAKQESIEIIALLLQTNADELWMRQSNREMVDGKSARACSIDDITGQILAEEAVWEELKGKGICCFSIDANGNDYNQILKDVCDCLDTKLL